MRNARRRQLERIVGQIESWLLRDGGISKLRDHYSEAVLTQFGPNLARDDYARIVRTTIKFYLRADGN